VAKKLQDDSSMMDRLVEAINKSSKYGKHTYRQKSIPYSIS